MEGKRRSEKSGRRRRLKGQNVRGVLSTFKGECSWLSGESKTKKESRTIPWDRWRKHDGKGDRNKSSASNRGRASARFYSGTLNSIAIGFPAFFLDIRCPRGGISGCFVTCENLIVNKKILKIRYFSCFSSIRCKDRYSRSIGRWCETKEAR